MATRVGDGPTGRDKLLYYTLGMTPPVEHADWVRNDVWSSQWLIRRGLQLLVGVMLGMVIVATFLGARPGLLLGLLIGGLIGSMVQVVLMRDYVRRGTLTYYEKRWEKQRG